MRRGLQTLEGVVHRIWVAASESRLRFGDRSLDLAACGCIELVLVLRERLLDAVNKTVETIAGLDLGLLLEVGARAARSPSSGGV